ncbi:toprim domain-containing protein [Tenacibaculum maritimum]|uniref:toprim domain-containing protein n=1 Tax=Tenacibaculum maritimum TaxID=107401 RepID=UPI0012E631F7|nr:toprim domain-containing protein [Tenacibaculum maritimum]CAA0202468.1 conserved hypothetical protein [Tenacibaculum maritimum]CAA0251782.1 conserved hypothetical protein [Tenacibaculum maritimum]
MDIQGIKNSVEIIAIASQIGIHIEKNGRAKCPFHNDKTPSLQFSKEKQICTCFSSNCDAGTMDVVALVQKYKNWDLPQTLKWLQEQAGIYPTTSTVNKIILSEIEKIEILTNLYQTFERAFLASSNAKKYAESRNIHHKTINVGYNSGTFHHSVNLTENREETLKKYVELGLLKKTNSGYMVFGKGCLVFPLKNKKGQVVSFYFRETNESKKNKHYYLKNRQGLYPKYPSSTTKKLILTESIIDAISLQEHIKDYEILANYGTEGSKEQLEAINQLEFLEEIIIFFDGDTPGKQGAEKLAKTLQENKPEIKLKIVQTPDDEDVNSLLEAYEPHILEHLIKEAHLLEVEQKSIFLSSEPKEKPIPKTPATALNTNNPNKITYETETAVYYIKGGIRKDLDSLKVTLVIEHLEYKTKSRNKLDLYEDKQTEKISREASEKLNLRADLVERDLNILTDLLDEYREENTEQVQESKQVILSKEQKEKCIKFLKTAELLFNVNDLIGKSGVVGEENNRVFLFVIASSYKMQETLHALIQGSSGSGKTHLLNTIMDFMPPEDTISLTRVTESSFYNYGQYELQNKLIGMEDFDGLEEKAELAFRELQSKGMISSSTSGKNESTGKIEGYVKEVFGPIASLSATTKGEIYEDNMSRSFLVAVDESKEQTLKIIQYQNNKSAGLIDKNKEKEIRGFLRDCMRLLQPFQVINPYANKIDLPNEAHKIRRLNDLFQSFIKQVTLLNQYQRNKDTQGRLITDKEDVKTAIEIMFDSIILKVDELDGSLRDFYETLKQYVLSKSKEYEFTRREIRHETKISNTQLHRYMKQLLDLEYIYQSSGYDNRGHKYKIAYWDNMEALRDKIKSNLNNQLEKL